MSDTPDVDFRALYGKEYIGAWDLPRDVTVTIERVAAGEMRNPAQPKAKGDKKPILYFVGRPEKGFVCNVTNGKIIAAMYGTRVRDWVGKKITLYATTTTFGPKTVECVRVRPKVPTGKGGVLPETPRAQTTIDEPAHEVAPDPLDASDDGSVPGL